MPGFNMDDYVPVNERIIAFLEKHPDGSLQSDIIELTADRVTVKAYAYRTPDDPRPGIGHSSESIPGATTFTRGSEVENAETSAWGRAIAALGFEVKRGIASREEARNAQPQDGERSPGRRRSGDSSATTRPAAQRTPEEQSLIGQLLELPGMTVARMQLLADAVGIPKGATATADQLREMLRIAQTPLDQPGQPAVGMTAGSSPAPAETPAPAAGQGEAVSSVAASPTDTPDQELPMAPPATAPAVASPPPPESALDTPRSGSGLLGVTSGSTSSGAAAPTDEEILAAAGPGAEMVPPELQTRIDKARSKGKKSEPVQETLTEALGGVTSD